MIRLPFLLFFIVLTLPRFGSAQDFEKEVLPIFKGSCFKCHSAKIEKPKAGLRFDSAESIAAAKEDPGFDRILEVVNLPIKDDDHMPPKGKEDPLSKNQITILKNWIRAGAETGDFVAYDHEADKEIVSGLAGSALPTDVKEAANAIDAIIEKGLKERERSPGISDGTFLRRSYLTLSGRNPTADEARTFLSSEDSEKRSRLIDELLDSRGYLSHHYNYWADVFRVQSDQAGNESDSWITFLKESIEENTPYDQWIHEMITAEGRMWEDPAIGFLLRDSKNRLAGYESHVAVLMGLEIGCAQCHDHPTEPLTQHDYFAMWGYFIGAHPYGGKKDPYHHLDYKKVYQSVEEKNAEVRKTRAKYNSRMRDIWQTGYLSNRRALEIKVTQKEDTMMSRVPSTYRYDDVAHKSYLHPEPIYGSAPELKKSGQKPAVVFADWLTSPDNLRFTHVIANRIWAKVMGKPVLGNLTNAQWPEDSDFPELADHLARLMVSCDYDLKHFQRILMNTRTWQSEALAEDLLPDDFRFSGPILQRLSAEQVWDSLLTLVDEDSDSGIKIPKPDFEFFFALQKAKSINQYWSIIETHVDGIRERTGKSVADKYFKPSRDKRILAKIGYLEEELVRASEMRSPALPGHFVRVFGQGQREMTEDSWKNPTIPQSLMLLNGGLNDRMKAESSALSKSIAEASDNSEKLEAVYLSVLGRLPDQDERTMALEAVTTDKSADWHDLAWALINTTEFLFVP